MKGKEADSKSTEKQAGARHCPAESHRPMSATIAIGNRPAYRDKCQKKCPEKDIGASQMLTNERARICFVTKQAGHRCPHQVLNVR
jgi:hypothetical protein